MTKTFCSVSFFTSSSHHLSDQTSHLNFPCLGQRSPLLYPGLTLSQYGPPNLIDWLAWLCAAVWSRSHSKKLICFISRANSHMLATVYYCWIQEKLLSGSQLHRNASNRFKLPGRFRKRHFHHLPYSFPKLLYCQGTDTWPLGVQKWSFTSHNAGDIYVQNGYKFSHNLQVWPKCYFERRGYRSRRRGRRSYRYVQNRFYESAIKSLRVCRP